MFALSQIHPLATQGIFNGCIAHHVAFGLLALTRRRKDPEPTIAHKLGHLWVVCTSTKVSPQPDVARGSRPCSK